MPMTRTDLDNLAKTLETAVRAAQSNTQHLQESAMHYRIEQQDGRISAINYSMYVPAGREVHGHPEMIEIPLCSLRANRMYQVSKVSLQFTTKYQAPEDCQVGSTENRETPRQATMQRVLNWLRAWLKPSWSKRAHIELACTGIDQMASELRINGKQQNRPDPVAVR
jgi:hypothetical protein